ncbi:MAG: peptidylprolyl isomerase [Anaerolineaceae bacterium]|nr:MAG: peptidylprolyl isomerase [Anaerolineaceae bacterium]
MTHRINFITYLLVVSILSIILVACGPSITRNEIATSTSSPKQWDTPPEMSIDPETIYLATLVTEKGEIKIELFASKAPKTVNNFVFLARQGYYDGTTFHRVLPDFMAQGGDPTGTGGGGPGYTFEDEFHPDLRFDGAGYFAMANGGPNTNGSQFFITFGSTEYLTGRHTIFGKVVEGMDVVLSLSLRDPQENPDYLGDLLQKVEIEVIPVSLLPPPTATPIPVVPQLEEGRPLALLEIADREGLYTGKPGMVIDVSKFYFAIIETTKGEIEVELRPQFAPESVNNFYVLALLGYWDEFPIVFVEPDALVLTGSPAGRVDSDVGYTLPTEIGMPNSESAVGFLFRADVNASSGSQFYILLQDNLQLDGAFTVFGYVIDGLEVVRELTLEDRIVRIDVEER